MAELIAELPPPAFIFGTTGELTGDTIKSMSWGFVKCGNMWLTRKVKVLVITLLVSEFGSFSSTAQQEKVAGETT